MHSIDLMSYNLNYHAAYPELLALTKKHATDILCLQECYTNDLSDDLAGLTLASKTTTGELGLAIYYNNDRFSVKTSTSIPICLSVYERIHTEDRERLLIVELFDHINQQPFFIASFHATHLIATNHLRRKQVSEAFEILNSMHGKFPVVLTGDFNYPFFHGKLKRTALKFDYTLITTTEPTYYGRKFHGRFDMAATAQLEAKIKALPFGLSDHSPILMRLNLTR